VAPLLAVLAACGGGAAPAPTKAPPARNMGDQVADTAWDTRVLGEASNAANEVVRNAADCATVNPIIAEARAKLDEAEPRLRTVTGHATLATLRKQVAKVADLCAGT
jgi:hypothetical protein